MKNLQRKSLVRLLRAVALLLDAPKTWKSGVEIMKEIGAVPAPTRSLNVSQRRAFERLKKELRGLGLELECRSGDTRSDFDASTSGTDASTWSYRLAKRQYVLPNLGLTPGEEATLSYLRGILAQEDGFPLRAELGQAMQKLAAVSPSLFKTQSGGARAPAPEPAPPRQDPNILDQFVAAASEGNPVSFEYQAFHSDTTRVRTVKPYGFFTRRGVWYLVGEEAGSVRVFRVSRVTGNSFQVHTDTTFERPEGFSIREFAEVPPWNFQQESEPSEVVVQFDREEFWRVRSYCEKYGRVEDSGSRSVNWKVSVRDPDTLINWLLPLGSAARALSPPSFQDQYREVVRKTLTHYEN